jgi:hypothetical protein
LPVRIAFVLLAILGTWFCWWLAQELIRLF